MWKGEKVILRRRGNGGPGEGEEVKIILEWVTETFDNSQYSKRLIPESRSFTDFNRLCGTHNIQNRKALTFTLKKL
jgi:hypothetical protein